MLDREGGLRAFSHRCIECHGEYSSLRGLNLGEQSGLIHPKPDACLGMYIQYTDDTDKIRDTC